MAKEIELKLALPEAEHRSFLRHPLLRKATRRESYQLVNLYYDTPALALRKHGVALRLRAQGKVWLQTVKCAGEAAGGISARPEWETPYAGHFDFSAVDNTAVRDWLERPKLRAQIAPIFETNFSRMAWILAPAAGTELMLVLDRGWIAAGGRREAISEIEIELLYGDSAHLFSLARKLAEQIPIVPAARSKADRGYRLFKQVPMAPVKAAPLALAAADQPVQAFSRIALSCLDHLQQNHLGAISTDDPEYIHQMRVATRRLRAALRLFAPLLPDGFAPPMVTALRDMMTVLGQARDLDVLLAEIAEPVLHALPDEPRLAALVGIITDRRFACRRTAINFLRSPRYGLITLEILADLHGHAEKVGAGGTAPETTITAQHLGEFATERLQRLRKKVLKLARAARIDDPPTLHALRIGIKRLRYALEFFSPLASPIAMRRILSHLASLQETLGQINDLANAGALLMDCAADEAPLREAVTLIGGWHGPRHQALLSAIKPGLKQLGNLRLPKLHP
ncbi:CYTH and CHAD domain-containing protein [Rhodocyclaceae bacterium]